MNDSSLAAKSLDWGKLLRSPANLLTLLLLLQGLAILVLRFVWGLGGVTALDDNNPWGLWVAFDLLCGVALAVGGCMATVAVYLFGLKEYRSAVRPAIATAFLGYALVLVALVADVGQPWRLPYPLFWSLGTTSMLYLVGLCDLLILAVFFILWLPQPLEWLGWLKKLHNLAMRWVVPLTILGAVIATIHQSAMGSLYLIAPSKMHPLWYSQFIPVFFFFSSLYAGLSMVIVEGGLAGASKNLRGHMDASHLAGEHSVTMGFGKAAGFIMLGYFLIRVFDIALQDNWSYLSTDYGTLLLVELVGLTLFPSLLYGLGARAGSPALVRLSAVLSVFGIILYRFNVSLVAFNWQLPAGERYFPSLMEIGLSIFIVTVIVTIYRFGAAFMPMLRQHPDYPESRL